MVSQLDFFKGILIVQLFYAFAITILVYSMPVDSLNYVTAFSDIGTNSFTLEDISDDVQSSFEQQNNIPVIELGALLFYSGNILIDLLVNFVFAIPQMIGLLINGILLLFNVDSFVWATVELFSSVVIVVLYTIGMMQLLTEVRSGRLV